MKNRNYVIIPCSDIETAEKILENIHKTFGYYCRTMVMDDAPGLGIEPRDML